MILDRSSFVRVHMLLQRLRNLLTLAQWAKKQIPSAHLCHGTTRWFGWSLWSFCLLEFKRYIRLPCLCVGMEIPCVHCRDTSIPSDMTLGCWNREHRALKKHIWLGQLVQWWGIMGLLPKYPGTDAVTQCYTDTVNCYQTCEFSLFSCRCQSPTK